MYNLKEALNVDNRNLSVDSQNLKNKILLELEEDYPTDLNELIENFNVVEKEADFY